MLVHHTTTHYHKWVPFQVSIRIIDQVVKNITEDELRSLSQSWKLAYVGTVLSKSSQLEDKEFDLGQVKGNVVITKKVTIPAFQMIVAKGLTKVSGHHKQVHVLVEPFPMYQNISVGPLQHFRIKTRRILGRCGPPEFIWEGSYLGTPPQSWHDLSCQ